MKTKLISIFKYLLLFIFVSTFLDKIYNYNEFISKLYASPLFSEQLVKPAAWLTIIGEASIVILLLNTRFEKWGFLVCSVAFCFFTLYVSCLFYIFKDTRPCACGFLFEWMTYPIHIAVNSILFIVTFLCFTTYAPNASLITANSKPVNV